MSVFARFRSSVLLAVALALGSGGLVASGLSEIDWAQIDPRYHKDLQRVYERAESHPEDANALGTLGMRLQSLKRLEAAIECYDAAQSKDPTDFRWGYYRAVSLKDLGRSGEAVDALAGALELSDGYAPAQSLLGEWLLEAGDPAAAKASYQRALEIAADYAPAWLGLGRLAAENGEWDQAAERYRKAVELERNYSAAQYSLGMAYRRLGERDKAALALRRYERLRTLPEPSFDPLLDALTAWLPGERPGAASNRAFTQAQRGGFIKELEQLLDADPDLVSAHADLIALYFQAGDPVKAERHYRRAIELDPLNAEAHYNWGGAQLLLRRSEAALAAFNKALQGDRDYPNALVQSGLLIEQQGDADEAERRYRHALKIAPTHRQANYLLARRVVRLGRPAEAVPLLQETVRIEDDLTPSYLRALASVHNSLGQLEEARAALSDAHRIAGELGRSDLAAAIEKDLASLPPETAGR